MLFHHGVPRPEGSLHSLKVRQQLAALELPFGARMTLDCAYRAADLLTAQLDSLDRWLQQFAQAQPGCRALLGHYGIGPVLAPTILAELGDARRFHSSRDVVRYAGLDITVHASDDKRAAGHLSYQGAGLLRWALVEAAQRAASPRSPHHDYYRQVKQRRDGGRAALSVARLLARELYHTLAALGDEALRPPELPVLEQCAA